MSRKVVLGKQEILEAYSKRGLEETAEVLGVSVPTLRKRMAEHGIVSHANGWRPEAAIDKDVLVNLYQDHHVPEIAKLLSVDKKTVYARMREYGIELRRKGPVREFSPSKEELHKLYKKEGMSMLAIAKHFGVGETVVFKRLTEFGLARTPADRERDKKAAADAKKSRLSYNAKTWKQAVLKRDGNKCQKCGLSGGMCTHCGQHVFLHAHHIKTVKKHPELRFVLSNGITLCRMCHVQEHK